MGKLKLTYFDFHGGRGEPARIALSMGGIAFEDDRVAFADWARRKEAMPFGVLPVLEVDGKTVSQTNAINRYVGKLVNLYPCDPWEAALCDEAMDAVEDVLNEIVPTLYLADEEKKAQREALAAGLLPFYLTRLEQRLKAHGGRYFADDRLTIADLKVALLVRQLSGILDYVPSDLPERVAPKLFEHYQRTMREPGVRAYYAKHGVEA